MCYTLCIFYSHVLLSSMSALLLPRGLTLWDGLAISTGTYETEAVDLQDDVTAVGWQLTVSNFSGDLAGSVKWDVRTGPDESWVDLCCERTLEEIKLAPNGSVIYTTRELNYRFARAVVDVTLGTGVLRLTATGKIT